MAGGVGTRGRQRGRHQPFADLLREKRFTSSASRGPPPMCETGGLQRGLQVTFCTERSQGPEEETEAGLPPHSGLGTESKAKRCYRCDPHASRFSELGREQGRAYRFDSAGKETGGQEICPDQSEVTHEQGRVGPLFSSSENWAQPLPCSSPTSLPHIQALPLNSPVVVGRTLYLAVSQHPRL